MTCKVGTSPQIISETMINEMTKPEKTKELKLFLEAIVCNKRQLAFQSKYACCTCIKQVVAIKTLLGEPLYKKVLNLFRRFHPDSVMTTLEQDVMLRVKTEAHCKDRFVTYPCSKELLTVFFPNLQTQIQPVKDDKNYEIALELSEKAISVLQQYVYTGQITLPTPTSEKALDTKKNREEDIRLLRMLVDFAKKQGSRSLQKKAYTKKVELI